MVVKHYPEEEGNFLSWEIMKNNLSLNDGEMIINLEKKERDDEVQLDICTDYTGGLVMGTSDGERYMAQIIIPAREYTEREEENPNYRMLSEEGEDSMGTESKTRFVKDPVPFSMDRCTLILWKMEE